MLPEVTRAIAQALGVNVQISPMAGGTNRRTYLVQRERQRWVARIEPAPAISFERAILAQARAQAAGVRTPVTIAQGQTHTEAGVYVWSVETCAEGVPFDHQQTETPTAQLAIRDLGRQLRLLHAVEVDAFGDLPPRPYPVYQSFSAWIDNKCKRIADAVELVGGPAAALPQIEQIYLLLGSWYTGRPRFCKGDCASDNLLVDPAHGITIIDWEWAQGLDPAADLAFWCRATPDVQAHALLLDAYEPDDQAQFRRRIAAHRVVQGIETIHVFNEHQHAFNDEQRTAGFREEWAAICQHLPLILG